MKHPAKQQQQISLLWQNDGDLVSTRASVEVSLVMTLDRLAASRPTEYMHWCCRNESVS